jgi:hypothetical protein
MKIKIKKVKKVDEKLKGSEGWQTGHFEESDCGMYEGVCEEGQLHEIEMFYEDYDCGCSQQLEEAEYQGKKVSLGKPVYTPGAAKKKAVYVRAPNGKVKKVTFGDPNMKIKKSSPERRKSFHARHNCANPGPKTKARYWSCRAWE